MDGGQGRPNGQTNVLGGILASCSHDPITGFFRDGCCNTGPSDQGLHTVCAVITDEFLTYSKDAGNDLATPMPDYGFPGLKAAINGVCALPAGNRHARQDVRQKFGWHQPIR